MQSYITSEINEKYLCMMNSKQTGTKWPLSTSIYYPCIHLWRFREDRKTSGELMAIPRFEPRTLPYVMSLWEQFC